jgi:hypothetical protein
MGLGVAVGATGVAVGGGGSGVTVAVGEITGIAVDVLVMVTGAVVVSTDVAVAVGRMGVADAGCVLRSLAGGRVSKRASKQPHTTTSTARE